MSQSHRPEQGERQRLCADIWLDTAGSTIQVGNNRVQLELDAATGRWLDVRPTDYETDAERFETANATGGDVQIRVGGEARYLEFTSSPGSPLPGERGRHIVGCETLGGDRRLSDISFEVAAGGCTISLHSAVGSLTVEERFRLWPDRPTIGRNVRLRENATERLLRAVDLRLPGIPHEAVTTLEGPGMAIEPDTPAELVPPGRWSDQLRHDPSRRGLVTLMGDYSNACLGFGYARGAGTVLAMAYSPEELFHVDIVRDDRSFVLLHRFLAAARLRPGSVISVGRQLVTRVAGTVEDALREQRTIYSDVGITVPSDTPGWARQMRVYEAHIGPKFANPFVPDETGYEPYATVEALTRDLPRVRRLGFDVIQLMPRFPFPSYTIHDHRDVDVHYGGRQQVRRMVRRAHELDLQVLLDVVLHGVVDATLPAFEPWAAPRSPYLDDHPDWFVRTEDGEIAQTFTYAFDLANSDWQDYMVEVLCWYVDELDVDGFRIDAPTWNNFPNWDPAVPYKAGTSPMGFVDLFRKVREALGSCERSAVLYTEPGGPVMHGSFDLTYNYDENWLLQAAVSPIASDYRGWDSLLSQPMTARQIKRWLRRKSLLQPQDAFERVVRHVDSHDSFEWGSLSQFSRNAFGVHAARALFAAMCMLKGGVLAFVGAERGSEDFYTAVLGLRETVEFTEGELDLTASRASRTDVLDLAHVHPEGVLLVAVRLGDEPESVDVELQVRSELLADAVAVEPLLEERGEVLLRTLPPVDQPAGVRVRLDPFGIVAVRIREDDTQGGR